MKAVIMNTLIAINYIILGSFLLLVYTRKLPRKMQSAIDKQFGENYFLPKRAGLQVGGFAVFLGIVHFIQYVVL